MQLAVNRKRQVSYLTSKVMESSDTAVVKVTTSLSMIVVVRIKVKMQKTVKVLVQILQTKMNQHLPYHQQQPLQQIQQQQLRPH